jgi:hypothetical protein
VVNHLAEQLEAGVGQSAALMLGMPSLNTTPPLLAGRRKTPCPVTWGRAGNGTSVTAPACYPIEGRLARHLAGPAAYSTGSEKWAA